MADNGPISVSAPNVSLSTAVGSQVTFNTRYPFAKLDSTSIVSFQSINIFFNTDPPNPDGVTVFSQVTTVYQFPHGYKYVPTVWAMVLRTGNGDQGDPSITKYGPYGYENYAIAVSSSADNANSADFSIKVDATNIYLQVTKNYSASFPPVVNIIGYFLLVRLYVFVNDLSGTDVPTHS